MSEGKHTHIYVGTHIFPIGDIAKRLMAVLKV